MGDYRNPNSAAQPRLNPQVRANVLQSKLIGQSHPTGLTSNLLKLFEPRPPLEYKPPHEKRKPLPYSGMSEFVTKFAEPGDPEYAPPVKKAETAAERRSRVHKRRLEEGAKKAAEELEKYDPNSDPNISGDPYKTLFVARLNYETTEHRIKREFEAYGPIKRVRTITDKETNKPRGYAFIEYTHTRDMKSAYKQADGRKVDNKRVLVDVERGRTVPNWRPRRLGGGLGSTRVGGEADNQKYSGREPQQVASGRTSRSEEPRSRDDRHDREREKSRDREKSRERGRERDKERERSRERSYDRLRDRDSREEKHHRDRNRDKVKEKDRGRETRDRDRERGRDYDRDNKDRDSEHVRDRKRPRERDRDYDYEENDDQDRGRSRDRNRRAERDREYVCAESEDDRERFGDLDEHKDPDHENGQYDLNERGHREDGSRNYNWDYDN
ncbi:hypothetical protein MKW98_025404 [Papaver atlanticum]|uniref:RRM domain-containing protein n=1 Tax=Papaver atlanticum TaxID=357466 RepID=A0AAD4SCU1_9MAGN|nr:hypothetical protein MKW98_025404 [Papaver atlanticum]